MVVRVTAAPITLAAALSSGQIEQGGKLEVPVTVTRLYGFAGNVDVNLVNADGSGIKAAELKIPAGQTQGTLVLQASKDARVGDVSANIEARLSFQGPSSLRQPLQIRVVKKS